MAHNKVFLEITKGAFTNGQVPVYNSATKRWEPGVGGSGGTPGADGKSAYEVAVENGFVGTEEQWLDSLVGAAGPQGAAGETGATGPQGPSADPALTIALAVAL